VAVRGVAFAERTLDPVTPATSAGGRDPARFESRAIVARSAASTVPPVMVSIARPADRFIASIAHSFAGGVAARSALDGDTRQSAA
jgi:hypothetical protein